MRTLSSALRNRLNNAVEVRALPEMIIEWNQNRYAGISKVDSIPAQATLAYDKDCFPVSSIVEANRPTEGVVKGITAAGESVTYWRMMLPVRNESFAERAYRMFPQKVRYYSVDAATPYKYWVNYGQTSAVDTGGGNYEFESTIPAQAFFVYKNPARTNKIVVGFETSWARPRNFVIEATTDNVQWFAVANNPTINSDGQVILYQNATGNWTNEVYRDNATMLLGLRVRVTSMNKPQTGLHLIELSCRLEADVSEHIIDYSSDFTMDEPNFITPLGTASSNDAEVTLSNIDGLFNNDNKESPFQGLIDANAKVALDLVYDIPETGGTERIRQFTMYADQWGGEGEAEISLALKDYSKFFMEEKAPNRLMEEVTIGEAIWRICDAVGFVDYSLDRGSNAASTHIPWFWSTSENTVWEVFQQLAEATQTAVFFDEYGKLRIQTREAAFDKYKPVSWEFDATNDNGKLADIEMLDTTRDYEANAVDITYKNTRVSDYNLGWPIMEVVWTPEGTFVLRAGKLAADLSETDMVLYMNKDDATKWQYEGMFQLQGEIIRYKGKEYTYYKTGGSTESVWLYSVEEQQNIDNTLSDEYHKYKNGYSGRLKLTERGAKDSAIRNHSVAHQLYSSRHFDFRNNGSSYSWGFNGGIIPNYNDSTITLRSNNQFDKNRVLSVTRGLPTDPVPANFGTRLRIPRSGYVYGAAGIHLFAGDGDSGYFIELMPSKFLNDNAGIGRTYHNELMFYRRDYSGALTHVDNVRMLDEEGRLVFGSSGGKGVPVQVTEEDWYDLDVEFRYGKPSPLGGYEHTFMIYVNGVATMAVTLSGGRLTPTGKYGMFIRGDMRCDFEYFYAHQRALDSMAIDDYSIYDRIKGGNASAAWDRDYAYLPWGSQNWGVYNESDTNHQFFFDEFGPIMHEVREMKVSFEKAPVIHSQLFMTNESQIVMPDYTGNPFGAEFTLANASRENAVANGEDLLMFGKDKSADQKMAVTGRLVYQEDEQTHSVSNEDAIRARGRVEVEINNPWIQTKAEAESLGAWILDNWAGGCDEISMSVFGHPAIQLGDLVTVNYPEKGIYKESHFYFVVGVSSEFNDGLGTSLTLRRMKN